MRFIHTSDLHLGRRIFEFSLIDDQRHMINELVRMADEEKPDALVIAGDIFDRSTPSVEAVGLFDELLTRISRLGVRVIATSGNHDSAERVAFGGSLMRPSGVFLSRVFDGNVEKITLSDDSGEVDFWMIPFIRPGSVRRFFPDAEFADTNDALSAVIGSIPLDRTRRNVAIAHQFVTGAIRSESEEVSVGGSDNVDVSLFADFDYAALGHIHRPQSLAANVRYSGSPLKYSFSESLFDKSATLVEIDGDRNLSLKLLPIVPLHEMRELCGKFSDLVVPSRYEPIRDDYVHVILTDDDDIPDAAAKLRLCYRGLMKLSFDNTRTHAEIELPTVREASPIELFSEFYEKQNGRGMSDEQLDLMKELIGGLFDAADNT